MNRNKTFLSLALTALFAALPLQAVELPENTALSITTDFAFYPKSDYIAGKDHFAPLTGFYSGLEGRVVGKFTYTIPTPLGESWLVSGANVELTSTFELTPITAKPGVQVTFTPLPFLVFNAGTEIGSGWSLFGLNGIGTYNGVDAYTASPAFSQWFWKAWAQATFQFDTGALIKGDWSHVVMLFTYQVYYHALLGQENQSLWLWQNSGNRVNGLQQYMQAVLAYQMPLVLKRVGLMFEMDGYLDENAFANPLYDGDFMSISLSPLLQFEFDSHNSLSVLFGFSSRRSFATSHEKDAQEPHLAATGREWYFKRLALSYTYQF